jgi:hypothetical protein
MVEDPSMGLLRLLDPGRESGIAHRPLALESGMAVKVKRLKTFSILLIILHLKNNNIDPLWIASQYTSMQEKKN